MKPLDQLLREHEGDSQLELFPEEKESRWPFRLAALAVCAVGVVLFLL